MSTAQVHVWLATEDALNDVLRAQYRGWLSATERARWQSYRFAKHQDQFLLSHALTRWVLSHYEPAVRESVWEFEYDEFGRPAIDQCKRQLPRGRVFNLSRTEGLAAVAVTPAGKLGVDVEARAHRSMAMEIAQKFFAPREVRQLSGLNPADLNDRFYRIWTLKEAYLKGLGLGLSVPLHDFWFDVSVAGEIAFRADRAARRGAGDWQFWQCGLNGSHQVSMAYQGADAATASVRLYRCVPGQTWHELACPEPRACSMSPSGPLIRTA